jgi:putative aldouronate transport system permease protein
MDYPGIPMTVNPINPSTHPDRFWKFKRNLPLYLMVLPAVVLLILFKYYPMYGISIAFQNFKPLLGVQKSAWVGLYQFQRLFSLPNAWELFRNTLVIACGKLFFGTIASLFIALSLNEVRNEFFKRGIQLFTYLLHFFSWLILGRILIDILSTYGIVNSLVTAFKLSPIAFLGDPKLFQSTAIMSDVWKEFGFGAIIYLAALTGISPDLYEAAAVDGANRFQRMWHITLPGISSTIVLLTILNLGWILDAGFEQLLIICNPAVASTCEVIDLYVYKVGLLTQQFSLGTAVGLFKSVIGIIMISVSWYLAKRFADYRIF